MIPIELKIKGLYSFKEEQVIDFSTLLESHLFGIFGKVGSGKSTILEAISFVLYGQAERLNARDNRNYNMMNLLSQDMNIEFTFKSGKQNTFYKAIASAKRNRKRHEDVKKIDRKLYRQEEGEWMPISVEEIPSIVGLSYDNFKRAIIIPQGKFQEFLGLKSTERSEMLKEIFNLNKFDLHHKAAILANRNKEKISHLSGQLAQLEDVSVERLKAGKTTLETLEKSLQKSEIKLKKEHEKLKESEKVKVLFEDLEKAKTDYQTYVEKYESRFLALEVEAKNIAYCNEFFKADLEHLKQQEMDVKGLEKEIIEQDEELQVVDKQLFVQKDKLAELKEENDKKDYYQEIALGIAKGIERLGYVNERKSFDIEWERLQQEVKGFDKAIEKLEQEEKEHKTQLEKWKNEAPNLIELIKIRDWYEIDKDTANSILEQQKELKWLTKKMDDLLAKKVKIVQPIFSFLPQLETLSIAKGLVVLKQSNKDFLKKIKEVTKQERRLMTESALASHASGLKDGAPCPLCGALEHPKVLDEDDLGEQLHQVQLTLTDYQEKFDAGQAVLIEFSALASLEANHVARIEQIDAKVRDLRKQQAAHQKTKFWRDVRIDSLEAILGKVNEAEQIYAKMDALSKQVKEKEQVLQDAKKKLKVLLPKLDAIEKKRDQLQSKADLLQDQIMPKVFERIQADSIDEMKARRKKYLQQIDDNDKAFVRAEREVKKLEEHKTTIETTLKIKKKSLQKEQTVLKKITQKLSAQVAKSNFEHLDGVMALLAKNIDPKNQLERVEKYKKEVFAKKQKWDDLRQKTSKVKFDADAFAKLKLTIQTLEEEQKNTLGQLAKTKAIIQELTQKVKEKKALKKELNALELRAENIKTLLQLFKGQGFVSFISSVYLQNIVNAANHRFQSLTKHELSLELEPDNSFSVRDQLNGGRKRNIKTLSGGQTFQAALCLALALADNIHELTKAEKNFFFLDEGFGSQDNDSIAAVFKTLKALRKENRTVGIISHVDILQQEIDVHLMVELDAERGSVVRESW